MTNLLEQECIQDGLSIVDFDTHFIYSNQRGEIIKRFLSDKYGVKNEDLTDELIAVFVDTEECARLVKYEFEGEIEIDFENILDTAQERFAYLAEDAETFYDYNLN